MTMKKHTSLSCRPQLTRTTCRIRSNPVISFLLFLGWIMGNSTYVDSFSFMFIPNDATNPQRFSIRRNSIIIHSQSGDDDCSKSEKSKIGKNDRSLQDMLLPSKKCNVDQMSGTELAYIGDVVFELYIRSRHVWPSKRVSDLQHTVVSIVRAEHQSILLEQVKSNFPLSSDEKQIIARGRNSVTRSKNRRNPAAYQDSTAFEAFIGYLYISNQRRCEEVLNFLDDIVDQVGGSNA